MPRTTSVHRANRFGVGVIVALGALVAPVATPTGASPPPHASPAAHSATCRLALEPGAHSVPVVQEGIERPLYLYVPETYDGSRVPLAFLLHGATGTGEQQAKVPDLDGNFMFLADADKNGYAIAAPNGAIDIDLGPDVGTGFAWNVDPVDPDYLNDVEYIDLALDAVANTICVDKRRVYAIGASSGGRMASELACYRSDTFAAIAPIMRITAPDDCSPDRPVPSVTINGALDPRAPRHEIFEALTWWVANNRCLPEPRVAAVTENVDVWQYLGCRSNGQVWFYDVKDGGHTFPGADTPPHLEPFVGPTNTEISTAETIWAFLRNHHL